MTLVLKWLIAGIVTVVFLLVFTLLSAPDDPTAVVGTLSGILVALVLIAVLLVVGLRASRRKQAQLLQQAAEALDGRVRADSGRQDSWIEFDLAPAEGAAAEADLRPAELGFILVHDTTPYTQLVIELEADEARPMILVPHKADQTEIKLSPHVSLREILDRVLRSEAVQNMLDEYYRSPPVRLHDAAFEYRFKAFCPDEAWTRAFLDDELRSAIEDFCHDLGEYTLYLHGAQQLILSRIERLESIAEIQRFVALGRLMLQKHRAASKAVPQRPAADAQERVCRICDDEILAAATACPSCGALYHLECWQLETECPACRHRIEDADASAGEPLT